MNGWKSPWCKRKYKSAYVIGFVLVDIWIILKISINIKYLKYDDYSIKYSELA